MTGKFDPKFLAYFMCPISKSRRLEYDPERNVIISPDAGVFFPIENGNEPNFKVKAARPLSELRPLVNAGSNEALA